MNEIKSNYFASHYEFRSDLVQVAKRHTVDRRLFGWGTDDQ